MKKFIVFGAFLASIIFLAPSATCKASDNITTERIEELKESGKYVEHTFYANRNVNYRTGPGTSYKKVGTIKRRTKVIKIANYNDNWSIVKIKNKYYFMYRRYLSSKRPPKWTSSELRLMSTIIYLEAGNQCYAGKQAVGIVVMNRVRSKKFPNS